MKLLDRLILLDLVPKLLMGIGMFSTFFFALGPLITATRFLKSGISRLIVLQFMGWDFAGFVSFTLPLGMLIAALLGFERLSRDSEAVALFAGGVSFRRMIVPLFGLSLVVSLVGYLFNDRVASYASQRKADIKEHYEKYLGESNKPFDFASNKDGHLITVHIEKGYDVREKAMRQVTITLYDPDGRPSQMFYADRAQAHGTDFHSWTLHNATQVFCKAPGGVLTFSAFDLHELTATPEMLQFLQRDPDTLSFSELRRQISALKASGSNLQDIRAAEVNLWFKTSLPFSCLIFGLVGAPLGMRSPRSAKVSGAIWALPIMLGYYVLYMTMSNIAQGGGVSPFLAAWLPNILGLFVGSGMIWKTST